LIDYGHRRSSLRDLDNPPTAAQILNANNIQIQGTSVGLPTVQAPNVSGALTASNSAGSAAQQAAMPQPAAGTAQPSVIIVEVLGFGGSDDKPYQDQKPDDRDRRSGGKQSYNPNSAVQFLSLGVARREEQETNFP
jgi:hypothetical protein